MRHQEKINPTMDINEFMDLTGLKRQTIYNRLSQPTRKGFPFKVVRIGRKLRFPRQGVYDYLETGD